ncbi:MAG: ABC transporter substrate-binding protein, partial [Myxococcales bacterium]|nr:ABC transporter substrate-binding protein [Myxococcales bacterium]
EGPRGKRRSRTARSSRIPPAAEAWRADAEALIHEMVDWDTLVQRSLGASRWDKLVPKEQERFTKLLRSLIEASYQSKMKLAVREKDEAKPGEVKIKWTDEELRPDEARLAARVTADKGHVDLEFHLSRNGDAWRLYDLVIDGSSTVRLYRSMFRQIIRDEGWDGLMARLQKKLDDVKAGRGDFVPGDQATTDG